MSHLRCDASGFDSGALFYVPKFLAQKIIVTPPDIVHTTVSITSDIEPLQFLKDTSTDYYVIGSTVTIKLIVHLGGDYNISLYKDGNVVAKFVSNNQTYTATYKLTPYMMFNDSSDTITFTIEIDE